MSRNSLSTFCKNHFTINPEMGYEEMSRLATEAGFTLKDTTYRVYRSQHGTPARRRSTSSSVSVAAPVADAVLPAQPIHSSVAVPLDLPEDLKSFFDPPKIDKTHVVNEELVALFDAVEKASNLEPQNVRLTGPAGCGKTTTAMEFAARYGRPLLVMDCPNVRDPRDWFGYKDIDEKGLIRWHKSLFYRFVQTPGAVIVLDEINRLNPLIVNTLLPLLDGRRQTYLEESGEKIVVGKGVVFFSTTNEGREFTGTIQLDLAQADRLCTKVECTYLQEKDESKLLHERTELDSDSCKKLVQVANHVRRKYMSDTGDSFTQNISTRMLLNAAQKMHLGGAKTLRYTLLSHFSDDGKEGSERAQLLKLLQGKFGPIM